MRFFSEEIICIQIRLYHYCQILQIVWQTCIHFHQGAIIVIREKNRIDREQRLEQCTSRWPFGCQSVRLRVQQRMVYASCTDRSGYCHWPDLDPFHLMECAFPFRALMSLIFHIQFSLREAGLDFRVLLEQILDDESNEPMRIMSIHGSNCMSTINCSRSLSIIERRAIACCYSSRPSVLCLSMYKYTRSVSIEHDSIE